MEAAAERIRTLKAQNAPQEEVKAAVLAYIALADAPPLAGSKASSSNYSDFAHALSAAIEEGDSAAVDRIVSAHGTGLSANGFNLLMHAAANRKGASVVKTLIAKRQFDLNTRSTGKIYNFPWNEEYLLAGDVDGRYEDEVTPFDEGLTAIQLSALSGSLLSFNELLKAGASLGPDTAEGRSIKQLIGLRYEPGGADSKKALVRALLEKDNEGEEESTHTDVKTNHSSGVPAKSSSVEGEGSSSETPNVVFHLPSETTTSEKKNAETPVFLFSVKGQQGAIPQIGYGTAKMPAEGIKAALKVGVRHLDGALLYGNQVEVGKALAESGLKRDEVFLTSKVSFFPAPGVWMYNENNLKGKEAESIDLSLKQLGVSHVDLMLVHNPCSSAPEYTAAGTPHMFELMDLWGEKDAIKPTHLAGSGESVRDALLLGLREKARQSRAKDPAKAAKESRLMRENAWKALEEAQKQGKCTYIGVANYPPELLLEMQEYATVMPCVNQVEFHPRFSHPKLQKVCKELGMVITGYGSGNSLKLKKFPVIDEIASRIKKSPLQVILKWTLQNGVVVIPAASKEAHIRENLNLYDFELSQDDMAKINALNEDYCYYWDPRPTQDTVR